MAKKDTKKSRVKSPKITPHPVKKPEIKKASKAGRKTKYHEDFPLLAQDFARQGMIDKEICKKLGISQESFYLYLRQYPEFADALKEGKKPVDVEVENALLKRAKGFSYEEVHIEFKPKGEDEEKAKVKSLKKITKVVVPDTGACIIWLKNRRPTKWKDKHELDLGNVNIRVVSAVPRSKKKKEKK